MTYRPNVLSGTLSLYTITTTTTAAAAAAATTTTTTSVCALNFDSVDLDTPLLATGTKYIFRMLMSSVKDIVAGASEINEHNQIRTFAALRA